MVIQINNEVMRKIPFLRGLDDTELSQVAELCEERSYSIGEVCQVEGQSANKVFFILEGKVGAVLRIPNIAYCSSEIILDTLRGGDIFGWSSLMRGTPWSTLKVMEPTKVMFADSDALLDLCDNNPRIGYVLMKNLSSVIASRLRRNRMSTLNALVAIKGI
jgi:CRP/FNR family transcriptional regulator, cyclic AMP receptor protein